MANDLLVFEDDMMLGIQSLDDQHKEFYLIYNSLIGNIAVRGRDPVDLSPVIRDLYSYFINHFQLEELIMRHIDYPFLREHKKAHRDIFGALDDLSISLTQRAITLEELLKTLQETACTHFRDVDRGIGIHYRIWLRSHPEGAPMGRWGG